MICSYSIDYEFIVIRLGMYILSDMTFYFFIIFCLVCHLVICVAQHVTLHHDCNSYEHLLLYTVIQDI